MFYLHNIICITMTTTTITTAAAALNQASFFAFLDFFCHLSSTFTHGAAKNEPRQKNPISCKCLDIIAHFKNEIPFI